MRLLLPCSLPFRIASYSGLASSRRRYRSQGRQSSITTCGKGQSETDVARSSRLTGIDGLHAGALDGVQVFALEGTAEAAFVCFSPSGNDRSVVPPRADHLGNDFFQRPRPLLAERFFKFILLNLDAVAPAVGDPHEQQLVAVRCCDIPKKDRVAIVEAVVKPWAHRQDAEHSSTDLGEAVPV